MNEEPMTATEIREGWKRYYSELPETPPNPMITRLLEHAESLLVECEGMETEGGGA